MENFFINDNYCNDLEDLIRHLDLEDDGSVEALPEDWQQSVEIAKLEPIFQIDEKFLVDTITSAVDKWEDRFPDPDFDDAWIFREIKKAITQSIDVNKLNSLLPKLYYPSNEFETIYKQDLLEYIK